MASHFSRRLFFLLVGLLAFALVSAQSSTPTNSQSASSTLSPTSTINSTSSSSSTSSSTSTPSATPAPIVLQTVIDPAFGILGAILILTGIPTAFLGHRNRWTSFFLTGFYTLSLVCIVLIIKFGVLAAVHPPTKTIRGMFLLASLVAGVAGGAITIFFWKGTRYVIGAWGGFAFALWIQCFRNGGLIGPIGFRWIMYIGFAAVGFVLCTIPKMHYHVVLVSTAFVGATSLMLGIDCFTTADLKEFYMWNLGFDALFPKFVNNHIAFPVSQIMEIELSLMGAVSLMGIAVQFRLIKVLQRKLKEIKEEQKKRDEEEETHAAERFAEVDKERDDWERDHPTLMKHGRNDSNFSNMPLMKDTDTPGTPSSMMTLTNGPRQRYQSGVSDFFAANPSEDELKRIAGRQSPGALPTLDLGLDIQDDVPRDFIAGDRSSKDSSDTPAGPLNEELKQKEALLAEIQTIRRSIDALKIDSSTPTSSTPSQSRHQSFSAKVNMSTSVLSEASHLRPPRQQDPRARAQSMEASNLFSSSSSQPQLGQSIGRPNSAPLRDEDWDLYVRDRKLLQPPSGVTPPIPTTSVSPTPRIAVPSAVAEALARRQKVESAYEMGELPSGKRASTHGSFGRASPGPGRAVAPATDYFGDAGLPLPKPHPRRISSTSAQAINPPPPAVTVLPPQKTGSSVAAPIPQRPTVPRVITFEELTDRHREKMRDLQAPLTQATKEQAELEAAKARWERAKALEKEAVARRQTEKAKEYAEKQEKRRQSEDKPQSKAGKPSHTRGVSGDKLAALSGAPTSTKRLSTMKVEDWQKYQGDLEKGLKADRPGSSRRDSRGFRSEGNGVPFPEAVARSREPAPSSQERRRSSAPRIPPH